MRLLRVAVAMLGVSSLFWTSRALAAETPLGAAFAEAPLPDGASSVWGALGWPGVFAGYRQGFPGFEVGAAGGFDYSLTQFDLDFPFRIAVRQGSRMRIGVGGSVGGYADLGAKYYEDTNEPSAGLRLSLGGNLSYRVGEAVDVLGAALIPGDIVLTERGNYRTGLLVGGGVELGLGDGFTFGAQGLVGPELLYPRGGQATGRLGFSVLVALGRRLF
jgi:hypothetical protein